MKKLRFTIERNLLGGVSDVAYLDEDEDVAEGLIQAVIQNLHIDLNLTISGVTMHMAAWEDPAHWADDWVRELRVEFDDVPEAVAGLLEQAIESDG